MGNSFTIIPRKKMCKILNALPSQLFQDNYRVYINEAVLRVKDDFDISWDSSLNLSSESEESGYSSRRTSKASARSRDQFARLHRELVALREQVTCLVNSKEKNEKFTGVNEPSKEVTKESFQPPPAPPLPENLTLFSAENRIQSNVKLKENTVLRDITNVKLKPISSTPNNLKKIPKSPEIRNELYEILKRRYVAMHSPGPTNCNEDNEESDEFEDDDDSFTCGSVIKEQSRRLLVF